MEGYIKSNINIIYILLIFFLIPIEKQNSTSFIFILVNFMIVSITIFKKIKFNGSMKFKRIDVSLFIALLGSYFLEILTTNHSIKFITFILVFLIIIIYNFYLNKEYINLNIKEYKIIYIIMMFSILFQYINYDGEIFILTSSWDKNYTGVILFLFLMYCNKMNYKIGILLSIYMSTAIDSRGYIVMIIIFYIIKLFKHSIYKLSKMKIFNKVYKIFILMSVFTLIFSYIWVYGVAANGVKSYQTGINDTSNKMRFAANIKVYQLINENKHLLINGYDNDIKTVLGVESKDTSTHAHFEGVRLVQSHNSILNVVIKTGLLFSILYFIVLSRVLDKYYTQDNIEYIIPYLINSIFMHSMLDSTFLLFWIYILNIPKGIYIRKKHH